MKANPDNKALALLEVVAGAAVHAPLETTKFGPHVAHVVFDPADKLQATQLAVHPMHVGYG
jgi:hypothetical protein